MRQRVEAAAIGCIVLAAGACVPAGDQAAAGEEAASGSAGAEAAGSGRAGPGATGGSEGTAAVPAAASADPYELGFTDADFPRVHELADGVYAYEQIHAAGGETITTVSLFVVTPEGVLVADGQENVEETRRLVEAIAEVTDRPITHLVIGSDHGDHTGGNAAFPAGLEVIAHPRSAAALEAAAEASGGAPGGAAPLLATRLVDDELVLDLGGREIRILHLGRAHTGGDLVVHVPDGGVLFMSETFLSRIFPAMRSAYPSEWAAMIDRALAMDAEVYVPGHGVLESPQRLREELVRFRAALERVIGEGRRLHAAGLGPEEALARADFGEIGAWTLSESQAGRALRRVYMELDGELPR